ncbi:MAG: phenylacetate--CoA ligase family protein [Fimbriimonadales bacterium]|nr:phenylacetate--CoA ligase family protein [Fimbriimonadales bacterium]
MRSDILARHDKGIRHPTLDAIRRAFVDLHESQWTPVDDLRARQLSLVSHLVSFASANVPLYAELYGGPKSITTWDDFRELPTLERSCAADAPLSRRVPARTIGLAAPISETTTSGTTGKKVVTARSLKFEIWRAACRLIEYDWARIDPSGSCLVVRSDTNILNTRVRIESKGDFLASWEEGLLGGLLAFGKGIQFQIGSREEAIAAALQEHSIDYIVTTPTTMETLIPYMRGYKAKKLFTIGEMLYEETRAKLEQAYCTKVFDVYGTREVGRVAAQCPDSNGYHVHDLNVILEIVDDDGMPCPPGQPGHVLLTSLHNFAMPMIRYRVGDIAVYGSSCPCNRSLSFVERFEGREVNRILLPGGRKRIARTISKYLQLCPTVENYQIKQWGYTDFEILIDGLSVLNENDLGTLKSLLDELVEQEASLRVTHVDTIPPLPSGKRSQTQILFTPDE